MSPNPMRLRFDRQSIPERWSLDRIGNRLKLNYGKSQAAVRSANGNVPVYGTGGLIEMGTTALCAGDSIVIGRKGTLDNPLYIEHPFWPVDTTFYTSDFDGSTKWLYYLVQTLGLASLNEATGVPSLSRDTFYKIEVPFPPKPEQSKIAKVLATVDRAIEQTEVLIAKYQRIKTGLMHDLLTRGIDEHGQLRDPATHQFKPSPLGMIPAEWEIKTLGSVVAESKGTIQTGPFGSQLHAHEYASSGVPVIMPQDILADGSVDLANAAKITEAKADQLRRHRVRANDVIFARRGDLSRCAAIPEKITAICGTGCLLVRIDPEALCADWLARVYKHSSTQRQVQAKAVGSTMVNLNTGLLEGLLIAMPTIEEQRNIVQNAESMMRSLYLEESAIRKLQRAKTGLMQDLLTGKVSVEPLL